MEAVEPSITLTWRPRHAQGAGACLISCSPVTRVSLAKTSSAKGQEASHGLTHRVVWIEHLREENPQRYQGSVKPFAKEAANAGKHFVDLYRPQNVAEGQTGR